MLSLRKGRIALSIFALALLFLPLAFGGVNAQAGGFSGAVYTLTNSASGNAVAIFNRDADGNLTPAGTVASGGNGLGRGLGSQSAVTLSKNNKLLFAVNAGSNSISAFKVTNEGLTLTDTVSSGGVLPTSLTASEDYVYVLNAGDTGNISGFRFTEKGKLLPLTGSTRPLSGPSTNPAQVAFSPDGDFLVVTEKGTSKIDTYRVGENGYAYGPKVFAAAGTTPFGFAFAGERRLIVSEAFGGAVNGSATSSYELYDNGDLKVISASVPTNQTAACWIAVSKNGKYAYAANAGSQSVSGYAIGKKGTISLLDANGRTGTTGTGNPVDEAFSKDGRFLYVLTANVGAIAGFRAQSDGHLTALAGITLPTGSAGLAAR